MTLGMAAEPATDNLTIFFDQLDKMIERHLDRQVRRRIDLGEGLADLWGALSDGGFVHALVGEDAGGLGLPLTDGLRLIRRLAYHATPLPVAESMIAHRLWTIAGGATIDGAMTLGPCRPGDRIALERLDGDRYVLIGAAERIPWGVWSKTILVFARDSDGVGYLCTVPTTALVHCVGRNLANEPRDTLDFNGVVIEPAAIRPAPAILQADGLLLAGAQLRTQQMVGAMERCLDEAIVYANERVQFGRPIGRFQAVQHMLAVAAGQLAAASAAADLSLVPEDSAHFALNIAIGKSRASEAATQVTALIHQVFGAMGFTQEHSLHYSTRRLWSWRDEFGGDAYWNSRIGASAAAVGGEQLWELVSSL